LVDASSLNEKAPEMRLRGFFVLEDQEEDLGPLPQTPLPSLSCVQLRRALSAAAGNYVSRLEVRAQTKLRA
jgi:hypothetical protein